MTNIGGVPRLFLKGTPVEMGTQHGEEMAVTIRYLASERLDIVLTASPQITTTLVEEVSVAILHLTKRLAPEIYEESAATAMVAGIEHWKLLVAGGFSDVVDICLKRVGGPSGLTECTLMPLTDAEGDIRLVGTWDTHASAQSALVVVERHPANGARTLALSTAGWPMQQGVTSNGLGFAIANLGSQSVSVGTSYICALPAIVAFPTTAMEAFKVARRMPLCSARYYAFSDAYGQFIGVESDGREFWATTDRIVHTNHFVLPSALHAEGRPHVLDHSETRRHLAEKALNQPFRYLFDIFSTQDDPTATISQFGLGRDDRTCAAFAIDPRSHSIEFTVGPPTGQHVYRVTIS